MIQTLLCFQSQESRAQISPCGRHSRNVEDSDARLRVRCHAPRRTPAFRGARCVWTRRPATGAWLRVQRRGSHNTPVPPRKAILGASQSVDGGAARPYPCAREYLLITLSSS